MSWSGPSDPARRAQWLQAQRSVGLAHHPDRGGDPGRYVDLMAGIDEKFGAPRAGAGQAPTVLRTRSITRRSRRYLSAWRTRLPRRLPGARRYLDL